MNVNRVSYGQLVRLLLKLEFVSVQVRPKWKAYRHASSETIILLPDRPENRTARDPEVISIRRHLVENALVHEHDFDQLLVEAA